MRLQPIPWTRERFMSKVVVRPDGCWDWLGHHLKAGYAIANLPREGRPFAPKITAHRLAYMLFVGPVGDDLDADHLCRNRGCVNPAHVEPVTHRENIYRMPGGWGALARMTECARGHELTRRADGRRGCRTCQKAAWARRSARVTAARRAAKAAA